MLELLIRTFVRMADSWMVKKRNAFSKLKCKDLLFNESSQTASPRTPIKKKRVQENRMPTWDLLMAAVEKWKCKKERFTDLFLDVKYSFLAFFIEIQNAFQQFTTIRAFIFIAERIALREGFA